MKFLLGLVLSFVLLVSCATFTTPKTKAEKIAYLNGLIASIENTAQNLFDNGKISIATAKTIQAVIHTSAQEIDLAQNATTDTEAETELQEAAVLLNSVNKQLQEAQKK